MKRIALILAATGILLAAVVPSATAVEPCTPQVGKLSIDAVLPVGFAWIDETYEIWYVLLEPNNGGGPVQALWGYASCRQTE